MTLLRSLHLVLFILHDDIVFPEVVVKFEFAVFLSMGNTLAGSHCCNKWSPILYCTPFTKVVLTDEYMSNILMELMWIAGVA